MSMFIIPIKNPKIKPKYAKENFLINEMLAPTLNILIKKPEMK